MERSVYTVCPCCGRRAKITKYVWDRDQAQCCALVNCICGQFQIPYSESRILKIDLNNPYMREVHFDFLIPAGWNHDIWNRFSKCLPQW